MNIDSLTIEDYIFIVLIIAILLNMYGTSVEKKGNKLVAHNCYMIALTITLVIYIYFVIKNYNEYTKSSSKSLYSIKLFGSIFLLIGICLLIYFQKNDPNYIQAPEI